MDKESRLLIIEAIGNTPLVQLSRRIDSRRRVWGKCEHLNPGGSVKDRLALAIIDDAEQRGLIEPGMTLIEATAGNTGIGLALVAAVRGYQLVCVMPRKMASVKRQALRITGAEVIIADNAPPSDPRNFQRVAERLAQERGWFLTDQFRTRANTTIHYETTGPELLRQTEGQIGALIAGVGTAGTISGAGRFLREQVPDIELVLADPVGSVLGGWVERGEPGPDLAYAVEGIGSSELPALFDRTLIDRAEAVDDAASFAMATQLIRGEGLLVGGSSGTAVVAAQRVAARRTDDRPVVALLADSWDRYWSQPWMRELGGGADSGTE